MKIGWLSCVLGLLACGDSAGEVEAPHPLCERTTICEAEPAAVTIGAPTTAVPSSAMPPEVISQVAHNNLDIAWHDAGDGGRLYFAFRTGPNHFASPEVVMYVTSTADLLSWRFEGRFDLDTDLREPQLLSFKGKLLFYFVELGTDQLDFEPRGVHYAEWLGPGQFSEVRDIFAPGFLVWRIKTMERPGEALGEWAYAFGYDGGENVYDNDGEPIDVNWLRSADGIQWEPVTGDGIVLSGGVSETDAVFMEDGSVVAVARNEAGTDGHFGSKICRAEAGDIGTWTCKDDKRKYDSPMVFRQGDEVFLLGRRNVTESGHYDLDVDDKEPKDQYLDYQIAYWQQPKRCALWKIDPTELVATWVADLPSAGDTCFPEAIRLSSKHLLVFNYSSPIDQAADPSWLDGQMADTHIYWSVIGLPASE